VLPGMCAGALGCWHQAAAAGGNYLDHVCRLHTALSNPQLMHRIAHDFHVLISPLLFSPSISNLRRPMWRSL
jgi:hypothetical protein